MRTRLPFMVSDSDWAGWAEARQQQQLVDELDALPSGQDRPPGSG